MLCTEYHILWQHCNNLFNFSISIDDAKTQESHFRLLLILINSFMFFKSKEIDQIPFFVSSSKLGNKAKTFDYIFFLEKTVSKGALYSLVPYFLGALYSKVPYFPRCPIFLVPYILGCPIFYGALYSCDISSGALFSSALYSHHLFFISNYPE